MTTPTPPPGYTPPPPGYTPPPPAGGYPPPPPPGYVPPPPAGYVPAPQPPAGPPPGPSGGRIAPWMIVVGVALILVVIGGIGLLIARAAGSVQTSATQTAVTPGQGTIVPLDEPPPTSEPLSPAPSAPTTEEPTTPEPPAPPTDEPTTEPAGDGNAVELGGGLVVVVPPGWQVVQGPENGAVLLGTNGAIALVETATGFQSSTAGEVALGYAQQVLEGQLQKVKLGKVKPLDVDSPTVTSAAVLPYKGVLVSQQGSQNVIGAVFVFIRQDGTALLVDATQTPDVDVSDGLGVILGSLLQTF